MASNQLRYPLVRVEGLAQLPRSAAGELFSNAMRLIPEELPIACGRLSVLIDREHDRLNVVIAPTFMRSDPADLGQCF